MVTDREIRLKIGTGYLCFESFDENEGGTSYVRILDEDQNELTYWDSNEWAESPEEVMGGIMGAIDAIHSGLLTKVFAPGKMRLPKREESSEE